MPYELEDFTRGFAILGDHEGDLVPVAVDANGNLYALLQGEYDGELRTVKLDAQGRISAFIIDSTDAWGELLSIGNAELAVRLGSTVNDDRRGTVQFAEGFQNGVSGWDCTTAGTGASVTTSPLSYLSHGYACLLTAGSDGLREARIMHYLPSLPVGKIGMSIMFAFASELDYFELDLRRYDGTTVKQGVIRYTRSTEKLGYKPFIGGITEFADVTLDAGDSKLWNNMKVVINPNDSKYDRVLVNHQSFDMSSYILFSVGSAIGPCVGIRVLFRGRAENNDTCFIDNVVSTVAET